MAFYARGVRIATVKIDGGATNSNEKIYQTVFLWQILLFPNNRHQMQSQSIPYYTRDIIKKKSKPSHSGLFGVTTIVFG